MLLPLQIDLWWLNFRHFHFPLCCTPPYEESLFIPELRQATGVGMRWEILVKGRSHRGWIGVWLVHAWCNLVNQAVVTKIKKIIPEFKWGVCEDGISMRREEGNSGNGYRGLGIWEFSDEKRRAMSNITMQRVLACKSQPPRFEFDTTSNSQASPRVLPECRGRSDLPLNSAWCALKLRKWKRKEENVKCPWNVQYVVLSRAWDLSARPEKLLHKLLAGLALPGPCLLQRVC